MKKVKSKGIAYPKTKSRTQWAAFNLKMTKVVAEGVKAEVVHRKALKIDPKQNFIMCWIPKAGVTYCF